jgi:hypothetical protein
MPRQILLAHSDPHRTAILLAGLLATALGLSTALLAQTLSGPLGTSTTTTAPATSPATNTSLPTQPRPHPIRTPDTPSAPAPANPSAPLNARVGSGPIDAAANPGQRNITPRNTAPSGQALTATLPPPGDNVLVFKNNAWLPAQVVKREGNQVFIRYDGEGGASDEWVGPNRVRSR